MKFYDLVKICESVNENLRRLSEGEGYYAINPSSDLYYNEVRYAPMSYVTVDSDQFLHTDEHPIIFVDKILYRSCSVYKTTVREAYYKHGKLHNLHGPAETTYEKEGNVRNDRILKVYKKFDRVEKYYINGIEYTKKEFDEYVKDMNKEQLGMLSDLGQTFE